MTENERKGKGQSHRSHAEGLAQNPIADEASVQVLGSLRNPLQTEAAVSDGRAGPALAQQATGCPALACDPAPSESSISGSGRAHCSCIPGTWCGGGHMNKRVTSGTSCLIGGYFYGIFCSCAVFCHVDVPV